MEYPFKELQPLGEATARDGYYRDWTHIDADTFHQISELVKFIREKGHGADTREAMAQALERVYHDAAQSGNSNMEVSMARGGFNTLGERLNNTTAQLAQTVKKGQVSINDININLGKITPNMVSDELLAQIAGNAAVNAVPADNSLTTEKYVDDSVTHKKVSFLELDSQVSVFDREETVNLFDKGTVTPSSGINTSNGELSHYSDYSASDFISVKPNTRYTRRLGTGNTGFYDGNYNFIKGFSGKRFFTTADETLYVRITVRNDQLDSEMLVEGDGMLSFYMLDNNIKLNESHKKLAPNSVSTLELSNGAVLPEKTTFLEQHPARNLFNKDTVTKNHAVNRTDGSLSVYEGYNASDFIEVLPNTEYRTDLIYSTGNTAFYDENFNFVRGLTGAVRLLTDDNTKYVRVSVLDNRLDDFMLVRSDFNGILPTHDFVLNKKIKVEKASLPADIESQSNISGLKWNALGDSITQGVGTTKSYVDYIVESTDVEVRNYGISGNMISSVPRGNSEGMSIRYADMDDDADIITVFGGTNDYGHGVVDIGSWEDTGSKTMYGGTKTLVKGLMSKYPTAKIGFILPIPRHGLNGTNNLGDFVNVIKDVCDRYSIPTLDLYHGSGLMPGTGNPHQGVLFNGTDSTHPNAEGHKIIATKIQRFLESL